MDAKALEAVRKYQAALKALRDAESQEAKARDALYAAERVKGEALSDCNAAGGEMRRALLNDMATTVEPMQYPTLHAPPKAFVVSITEDKPQYLPFGTESDAVPHIVGD